MLMLHSVVLGTEKKQKKTPASHLKKWNGMVIQLGIPSWDLW